MSQLETVTATSPVQASAGLHQATATCPAGKTVIAGGGGTNPDSADPGFAYLAASHPQGNGWYVRAYQDQGAATGFLSVTAYAVCAVVN